MKTLKDELSKITAAKDDETAVQAFLKFCARHQAALPLPGEDADFDKAMWAASQFSKLAGKDMKLLDKVVNKLLCSQPDSAGVPSLKLKDLVGRSKEAAVSAWQEMLAAMSWQQLAPAGALRGVGTQLVSLGTFARELDDASVQINIGWLVDKDQLRVLLQAADRLGAALPDVELRVKEAGGLVALSRLTNEDGAVVAPSIKVSPGRYCIQVVRGNAMVETPYFEV